MQIKASLVAALGLAATGFAAPQLSNPEIRSVSYGAPERPGPNFELKPESSSSTTTSYSYTANSGSSEEVASKKQSGGLGGLSDDIIIPVTDLTTDLTDVTTPVTDLTTDFTSKSVSVLRITDVVTSVQVVKTTVVKDVSCIQDLIKSVGNNTVGQKGLGEEIVKDLGDIVTVLTTTLEGTLTKTLPSVVKVLVTEAKDILAILDDVEAIVFQIVQVLTKLLGGLVTCMYSLFSFHFSSSCSICISVISLWSFHTPSNKADIHRFSSNS